jgi:hypothetical protein
MQDICELIELTECELDEVAGGNPFSITASLTASVSSTISAAFATAFANAPATAITGTVDNEVYITGP